MRSSPPQRAEAAPPLPWRSTETPFLIGMAGTLAALADMAKGQDNLDLWMILTSVAEATTSGRLGPLSMTIATAAPEYGDVAPVAACPRQAGEATCPS